jgi:hypothetical protein
MIGRASLKVRKTKLSRFVVDIWFDRRNAMMAMLQQALGMRLLRFPLKQLDWHHVTQMGMPFFGIWVVDASWQTLVGMMTMSDEVLAWR